MLHCSQGILSQKVKRNKTESKICIIRFFLESQMNIPLKFWRTFAIFRQNHFPWNPYLKTYGTGLLILFSAKDPKQGFGLICALNINAAFLKKEKKQDWRHNLFIRRPVPSTDQALPSCFYFKISWISMEQRCFYFFGFCGFLQGLRS